MVCMLRLHLAGLLTCTHNILATIEDTIVNMDTRSDSEDVHRGKLLHAFINMNRDEEIPAEPKKKRKSDSGSTQITKKTKGQEDGNVDQPANNDSIPQQKPRARMVLPKRSPLPSRSSRNVHPGLLDRPKSRRTSEEVAVATARKEELKAQLAKTDQERIALLAKMAMEEDIKAKAKEAAAVRCLQDMEASFDPTEMMIDDGTKSGDGASDGDEKSGPGDAKDKVGSKKARSCKSTAHCNTNSYS